MSSEHEKVDFFTEMMLGRKPRVVEHEEELKDEDILKETPRGEWLFGKNFSKDNEELPLPSFLKNSSIIKMLENIDYVELMGHIDTLTTATSELRPLFKKIKPLLEAFVEKDK